MEDAHRATLAGVAPPNDDYFGISQQVLEQHREEKVTASVENVFDQQAVPQPPMVLQPAPVPRLAPAPPTEIANNLILLREGTGERGRRTANCHG